MLQNIHRGTVDDISYETSYYDAKSLVIISDLDTLRPNHETETVIPIHVATPSASFSSSSSPFSTKAFCPLTLPS
jgi:hypothetical protein